MRWADAERHPVASLCLSDLEKMNLLESPKSGAGHPQATHGVAAGCKVILDRVTSLKEGR